MGEFSRTGFRWLNPQQMKKTKSKVVLLASHFAPQYIDRDCLLFVYSTLFAPRFVQRCRDRTVLSMTPFLSSDFWLKYMCLPTRAVCAFMTNLLKPPRLSNRSRSLVTYVKNVNSLGRRGLLYGSVTDVSI
jgi:hypothetical protein